MIKLSICIPTYNRSQRLRYCLEHLLPQLEKENRVEVVISDNASTDGTEETVKEIAGSRANVRYSKNPSNLGYAGNQIKCFELARGEYLAILCDDDVYTDGLVKRILEVISAHDYAFVALNYYSFKQTIEQPHLTDFAPAKDVVFTRAYDIINYPSVGHFSGFIFNTAAARPVLQKMVARNGAAYYEKYRGVITDLAVRSTLAAKLPGYFIGDRKLANRDPEQVDYDTLRHNCLDYYEYYFGLREEGLINEADLAYRQQLVVSWLLHALAKDSYRLSNAEFRQVRERLYFYLRENAKFKFWLYPLMLAGSPAWVRRLYRKIFELRQKLR